MNQKLILFTQINPDGVCLPFVCLKPFMFGGDLSYKFAANLPVRSEKSEKKKFAQQKLAKFFNLFSVGNHVLTKQNYSISFPFSEIYYLYTANSIKTISSINIQFKLNYNRIIDSMFIFCFILFSEHFDCKTYKYDDRFVNIISTFYVLHLDNK